ncbi:hypothetical protein C9374_004777 [Naegleria lovaniensis]|uniref:F-box domain-containing protein n=1 Tax=Naegleria lovaniensis TaxID=51637 RepID=A0AA88GM62_NAELO|nr:uncharacterized protein C9374_004777 [Naegleria lovaniensis]KAG2382810.1 hypothetical protein C9374_004777 [Naegleria lovaniensis]
MAHLSADDLFCILSFLQPQQVLASCCLVNRFWNSVASCNALWKKLCDDFFMMDEWWDEYSSRAVDEIDASSEHDHQYHYRRIFRNLMMNIPMYQYYQSVVERDDQWEEDLEEVTSFKICHDEYLWNPCGNDANIDRGALMKTKIAKLATILTILSNNEYAPNPWNDKIVLCKSNSRYEIVHARIIPLATFCACILNNKMDLLHTLLLDTEMSNEYLAISPFIEYNSIYESEECNNDNDKYKEEEHYKKYPSNEEQEENFHHTDLSLVKPFCYFEKMDDSYYYSRDEHCWVDSKSDACIDRFNWIPVVFNAGAAHYEYRFRAVFDCAKKELHVKKYFYLDY